VRFAPAGRTFLSARLRQALVGHAPEVILYVASSSTTAMSFWRSRVLKAYCPRARVVLVGLQARRHHPAVRPLIRRLAPELVCVQSRAEQDYLRGLGCRVASIQSGVQGDVFVPVDGERRRVLRAKYGLRGDAPLILHVGHLKSGRGIGILETLARHQNVQVVLVTSSSTVQDTGLAATLGAAGVSVISEYQPHMEHFYQMADCYVFPVESNDHSIGIPLSVLEALACDLPVVSTRFGGLPEVFTNGVNFVDTPADLVQTALTNCTAPRRTTRSLALQHTWQAVAASLLEQSLGVQPCAA